MSFVKPTVDPITLSFTTKPIPDPIQQASLGFSLAIKDLARIRSAGSRTVQQILEDFGSYVGPINRRRQQSQVRLKEMKMMLPNCGRPNRKVVTSTLQGLVPLIWFLCTSAALSPLSSHSTMINLSQLCSKRGATESDTSPSSSSRRDLLWKIPAAGVGVLSYAYSNLLIDLVNPILEYPQPHERRVTSTIATAFAASAASKTTALIDDGVFRVLEVGIGKDCRLFRRRLYDAGLSSIREAGRLIDRVDITGIDLRLPSEETVAKARQAVAEWNNGQPRPLQVNVQTAKGSITTPLDYYEDGHFDCVICCLTLCSVEDPEFAVQQMYRLIRRDGGTFGYLEHVAVNPDEPYRWLELQQKTLDPLQQILVDNCHLHRYTEHTIEQVFSEPYHATQISHERFLVDNMWPVTCQCCGVYQRTG